MYSRMMYQHELPRTEQKLPKAEVKLPPKDHSLHQVMIEYVISRGCDPVVANLNRWYPTILADKSPRLVIPATTTDGSNYYQARAMDDNPKRYVSPATKRGDAIVCVWPSEDTAHAVIVEGPFDALAAASAGYLGIALMGKTPPPEVLDHVAGYARRLPALVVADADATSEASRVASGLAMRGRRCRLVEIRPYKDLCAAPILFRQTVLDDAAQLLGRQG